MRRLVEHPADQNLRAQRKQANQRAELPRWSSSSTPISGATATERGAGRHDQHVWRTPASSLDGRSDLDGIDEDATHRPPLVHAVRRARRGGRRRCSLIEDTWKSLAVEPSEGTAHGLRLRFSKRNFTKLDSLGHVSIRSVAIQLRTGEWHLRRFGFTAVKLLIPFTLNPGFSGRFRGRSFFRYQRGSARSVTPPRLTSFFIA